MKWIINHHGTWWYVFWNIVVSVLACPNRYNHSSSVAESRLSSRHCTCVSTIQGHRTDLLLVLRSASAFSLLLKVESSHASTQLQGPAVVCLSLTNPGRQAGACSLPTGLFPLGQLWFSTGLSEPEDLPFRNCRWFFFFFFFSSSP